MSIKIICIVFNLLPEIYEASLRVTQTLWQYLEVISPVTLSAQCLFCSPYTLDSLLRPWKQMALRKCLGRKVFLILLASHLPFCGHQAAQLQPLWSPGRPLVHLVPPVHHPNWALNTQFRPPAWPNSYFLDPYSTSSDWLGLVGGQELIPMSSRACETELALSKGHYQVEEGTESFFSSRLHLCSKTRWEMRSPAFSCLKTLLFARTILGCIWDQGMVNLIAFPVSCPSQVLGASCLRSG